MRTRLFFLAVVSAACAFGQYAYEPGWPQFWIDPQTPDPAHWTQNGGGDGFYVHNWFGFQENGFGLFGAGSFIYVPTIASGSNSNDYEVKSTFVGCSTACIHFVRASPDALISPYYGLVGSFTAVSVTGQQLTVIQCVSGSCTSLGGTTLSVVPGTMRTVVWGTNLRVYLNNVLVWSSSTIPLTYGQPGVGGGGSSSSPYIIVDNIQIGHRDTVAPSGPSQTGLQSSIFPTSASLRWQGVNDDSNGIGIYGYNISRADVGQIGFATAPEFADSTVAPATSYTYSVSAVDYHGNVSTPTSWTITTPPAGAVDPRRQGVYTTGSYWGGGGEQIDTLSGNLNYSMPLVKPMGRPGWTVPVGLTYNSQNWRQDGGTNWQLGDDVGYGFGWKMQIGSITPYYAGFANGVHHYVFTDSTGAEYRLDQNSGGVWSSAQGIYVWFDANTNILHFRNGTFWTMGSTSGGAEQDAGTMYPTLIEDSSGNYVLVYYLASPSVLFSGGNSSSRISTIVDARGFYNNDCHCVATYGFNYATGTGDPIPHLSAIASYIGTAESYSGFNYGSARVSVQPAFGSDSTYSGVTTRQLASIVMPAAGTFTFTYDGASGSQAGASELTQVTFPWGGHLGWNYVNAHYAGNRVLREVGTRYLAADAAGTTVWSYPFTHSDSLSTIATVHADTTLADASGTGAKKWTFLTSDSTPWQIGLISQFTQLTAAAGTALTQDTYTWTQGLAGDPYISQKTSVRDGITAQSLTTTQTLDAYGNVTQSVVYPYNNTTTPLQTYTNTYITTSPLGSQYVAAYIRDRLTLSTITTGGSTTNLVQNYYDKFYDNVYTTVGCPLGTTIGNFGMWAGFQHTYSGLPLIGMVSSSVTPVRSTCTYHWGGVPTAILRTDGPGTSLTLTSSTGYTAPSTISVGSSTSSLSYNAWLGITQTTGSNGEHMYMTYDSYGRPTSGISPYGTWGTPTVTYTYINKGSYNPYTGLPATVAQQIAVGPNGFTRTTLDGLGRPIQVERGPDVSHIQSVVNTVYAPCACSPMAKVQSVSQPHAPGGTVYSTVYTYDGIGRTLSVKQPDGASTTQYAYAGNQTTVTDPKGNWKIFTTDELGNLVMVTEPDPCISSNTLSTSYTYDWMGHLIQTTMIRPPMNYVSGTCNESGTPTTQTRTFVYDSRGRLTSATNPESGTVTYAYNSDNTLTSKVDAQGQATVYTYDTNQRVTQVHRKPTGLSGAEDVCQQVNYAYGTDAAQFNKDRLTMVTYGSFSGSYADPNGHIGTCVPGTYATTYAENYAYVAPGGVASKTFSFSRFLGNDGDGNPQYANGSVAATYTYDSVGRTSGVSYPVADRTPGYNAPLTFSYGFDSMGRPATLVDNMNAYGGTYRQWVQSVGYDLAGRMTQLKYPKSTTVGTALETQTMTYDVKTGQLASMGWADNWNTGTLTPVGSLLYSYSSTQNNGQITQVDDQISKETIVYQYDSLKRLISATSTPDSGSSVSAWTQTYAYDGFGNLTGKTLNGTPSTIYVDSATNRLTSAGYDANGNNTQGGTIAFDASNRMISYAVSSTSKEYYGYAPDNKRIYRKKSGSGGEEWTLYGAQGEKLGTYVYGSRWDEPTQANVTDLHASASNVYFAGRLISDGNTVCSGSNCTRAVFHDRLGTNRASGARFYPYGEEISAPTSNDREKFGTYTRDSFSGMDYADQRYYASAYGRFNTADPYQASAGPSDPGSWNRYAYVGGDPVNRYDPRGLCWVSANGNQVEDGTVTNEDALAGYGYQHVDASCGGYSGVTVTDSPPEVEPDPCQMSEAGCGGSGTGPADDAPPPNNPIGGGGADPLGLSITSVSQAKGLLLNALDVWKNCDHLLGTNGDTLAKNLKFVDSTKDPSGGSWMASSGLGNTVTLYANFYGDAANGNYRSATAQAETLVHELFHKKFRLTRLDHVDFLQKFNIPKGRYQSTGDAIDVWIGRDCK